MWAVVPPLATPTENPATHPPRPHTHSLLSTLTPCPPAPLHPNWPQNQSPGALVKKNDAPPRPDEQVSERMEVTLFLTTPQVILTGNQKGTI